MTALPKRKISKGRKNRRRAHHALTGIQLVRDKKTGELIPAHTVNLATGQYKDKKVQKAS